MTDDPFGNPTRGPLAPPAVGYHGAGPAGESPKKVGMTFIAIRSCCRCGGRFSHPLEPGWVLTVLADGSDDLYHVCPGCALPGDLYPDGTEVPE